MPKTPDELFRFLDGLGIAANTVRHPPLFTVEQSRALRGEIAGAHTKNLFVKDRKDRYFLLTVPEDGAVDLKTVHTLIGASGKVSFGKPEALMDLLGVAPGAVTLFGAINDAERAVTVVVDEALLADATINAHPLTNEATTSIASADVGRFLAATGHAMVVKRLADLNGDAGSPHSGQLD